MARDLKVRCLPHLLLIYFFFSNISAFYCFYALRHATVVKKAKVKALIYYGIRWNDINPCLIGCWINLQLSFVQFWNEFWTGMFCWNIAIFLHFKIKFMSFKPLTKIQVSILKRTSLIWECLYCKCLLYI